MMYTEQILPDQLLQNGAFDNHEAVHFFSDEESGLNAIVAVHDRTLGPAAGGCRMWPYEDRMAALTDVLRLSRAMSFKNAMAGLPLGGGKAVIWSDRGPVDRHALFAAFGRAVHSLGGAYVTAEDVGTRVDDMKAAAGETSFVCGLPAVDGKVGGDPSPKTAHGVFLGLQAAVAVALSCQNLKGIRVAVQGLGGVGYHLIRELHEAGAALVVSDIDDARMNRAAEEFGAELVDPIDILSADVDVFAPCALGGILNQDTIPSLKAKVVAGAANNQLQQDQDGDLLRTRGILYAPDYVINAGGIIQVAAEYLGWTQDDVDDRLASIPMSLRQIFEESDWRHQATNNVADKLALARMKSNLSLQAAV